MVECDLPYWFTVLWMTLFPLSSWLVAVPSSLPVIAVPRSWVRQLIRTLPRCIMLLQTCRHLPPCRVPGTQVLPAVLTVYRQMRQHLAYCLSLLAAFLVRGTWLTPCRSCLTRVPTPLFLVSYVRLTRWLVIPSVLTLVCPISVELTVLVLLARPHRPIFVSAWNDSPPPSVVDPPHPPRSSAQQSLGDRVFALALTIATRPRPGELRPQAIDRVPILSAVIVVIVTSKRASPTPTLGHLPPHSHPHCTATSPPSPSHRYKHRHLPSICPLFREKHALLPLT